MLPTRRRRVLAIAVAFAVSLALVDWVEIYRYAAYRPPEMTNLGFEVRWSRAAWLPGPDALIPEQPCPRCRAGAHDQCAGEAGRIIFDGSPAATGAASRRVRMSSNRLEILVAPADTVGFPAPGTPRFELTLEDVVLQGGIYRAAEIRLPGTGIDRSVFVCPCCTEGK